MCLIFSVNWSQFYGLCFVWPTRSKLVRIVYNVVVSHNMYTLSKNCSCYLQRQCASCFALNSTLVCTFYKFICDLYISEHNKNYTTCICKKMILLTYIVRALLITLYSASCAKTFPILHMMIYTIRTCMHKQNIWSTWNKSGVWKDAIDFECIAYNLNMLMFMH